MNQTRPSDADAQHVLICLHERRLDRTGPGNPAEWMNACFAKRTGGEATWKIQGGYRTCQIPRLDASAARQPSRARLLQHEQFAPAVELHVGSGLHQNGHGDVVTQVICRILCSGGRSAASLCKLARRVMHLRENSFVPLHS